MYKFSNEVLDRLEDRLLKGMFGELEDPMPASVMEIFRRILAENGRLIAKTQPGQSLLGEITDDDLPFPDGDYTIQ